MPRKKPYSGKQKKLQLKDKRTKKGSSDLTSHSRWTNNSEDSLDEQTSLKKAELHVPEKLSFKKGEHNPDRYRLNFSSETRIEIERRKHEAQTVAIKFVAEKELEADIKDVYRPGSELDMPKRPGWSYKMSKNQLEHREADYFNKYLTQIYKTFGDLNLSYFEHNLETWRQLWRVLEMSDVVVLVTDVRHPILHFSPALYVYVVKELKRPLILVLNKIDLVPSSVVAAWTEYFKQLFPHLHVVWFTSFPQDTRRFDSDRKHTLLSRPRKRIYNTQIGPKELLHICQEICGDKVDMSSWQNKIESDLGKLGFSSNETSPAHNASGGDNAGQHIKIPEPTDALANQDLGHGDVTTPIVRDAFEDGKLTIGFVGHPNVGKSSLMNGLIGRKVVSTSVTPGHTKYFQTYFLTPTVRLCDSPGLVFPSLIDKQQQILSGIYPVSQVREPYTPVGYLAARLDLVKILRLKHPDHVTNKQWTPWDICEAWANQRNYKTAKAARPDVYRAANAILRMAVDGRLCMYIRPPGYSEKTTYWEHHENTLGLLALRSTGHYHGNAKCDSEGRPLNPEDFAGYSSESVAEYSGFSAGDEKQEYDESSEEEEDEEDSDDGDRTLEQEDFEVAGNKFAALVMEGEDTDDFDEEEQ